jgi:predicted amidohydrolase YtcJ
MHHLLDGFWFGQVLGADLIDRMARLGAVANIQPSFVGTDCKWVRQRIDPQVQQTSYCWKVRRPSWLVR